MRRDDVQIWLDRYIAAWSSYDENRHRRPVRG